MKALTIVYILLFWQDPQDPAIKQIKDNYSKVRASLKEFKKEEKELIGLSSEGGSAIYYRDKKGNVQLVTKDLYFESGKMLTEYYFFLDSLYFVYVEEHWYNVPFFVDSATVKEIGGEVFDPKKTRIDKYRYYFSKNKMIQWLGPNMISMPKDSTFYEKEFEILESCKLLFK